jgi:glycosyltransferase involved in cell wall biosynthesis
VPKENLAARIVLECRAGLVVEPTDVSDFCAAAKRLVNSPQFRDEYGRAAREYAEKHFNIRRIADQFEAILSGQPLEDPQAPAAANRLRI